jgi:hypothetical protein
MWHSNGTTRNGNLIPTGLLAREKRGKFVCVRGKIIGREHPEEIEDRANSIFLLHSVDVVENNAKWDQL